MAPNSQRGFTLIELLIVVAIVGIIAAMAVAGLLRARMAANEASAIGSLRTINSAQQAYASSCATGFYANSLLVLMSAPPGGVPFISPDLGSASTVFKSGYEITLAPASDAGPGLEDACNPQGTAANLASGYYATANRNGFASGRRFFWTGTPGTIYFSEAGPVVHAEASTPPPAPARPLEGNP